MHRSSLASLVVDCQTDDLSAAAAFWGAALGMAMRAHSGEEGGKYIQLIDPSDRLRIDVQSVCHPSWVHVDIESDDVESEVRRLEALGAKRLRQVHTWWVMEAPTGHRSCVVHGKGDALDDRARQWG